MSKKDKKELIRCINELERMIILDGVFDDFYLLKLRVLRNKMEA